MPQPTLTDDDLRRLKELLEHEGLEAFLPYMEQAAAEAKLTAARRLLWRTYRQMFLVLSGTVVAGAVFWEKATAGLGGFLRWVIGQ